MAVLDTSLLSEIQGVVIEPRDGGLTFPSGLWSASEVLGLVNSNLRRLVLTTAAILERDTSITITASVLRYDLPATILSVFSLAFAGNDSKTYALSRSDSFQADGYDADWGILAGKPRPRAYTVGELPSLQVQLMPASSIPGSLDILYVPRTADLKLTGDPILIPDELTLPVKWATLGDMLSKIGRSASQERAEYAYYRAQEMEAAANLMLEGWA